MSTNTLNPTTFGQLLQYNNQYINATTFGRLLQMHERSKTFTWSITNKPMFSKCSLNEMSELTEWKKSIRSFFKTT